MEWLRDFCVWRGCRIFLTPSLRLHDSCLRSSCDFFWGDCMIFCVERLLDIFLKRLHDLVVESLSVFCFVEIFCDYLFEEVA